MSCCDLCKSLWGLRRRLIVLFTLFIIIFKCSSNDSYKIGYQNSNFLMNPMAQFSMKLVFSCKKVILHQNWSFWQIVWFQMVPKTISWQNDVSEWQFVFFQSFTLENFFHPKRLFFSSFIFIYLFIYSSFNVEIIQKIILKYSFIKQRISSKKVFGCNRTFDFWYQSCPSDMSFGHNRQGLFMTSWKFTMKK